MASSPKAPAAPDYTGAANATAQGNLEMARYQTQANRINQTNPWGSLSYTNNQTFDQAAYDRAMADYNADPRKAKDKTLPSRNDYMRDNWSQTESLTPELQAALDSQIAIQRGKSDQAKSMLQSVKDSFNTPFQAPDRSSYMTGVGGVNQGDLGTAGQFSSSAKQNLNFNSGTPGLTTTYDRFSSNTPGLITDVQQYDGTGVNAVNQNAPQFDPAQADLYAKKAYEAQMALLRPDLDRQQTALQNGLALQGLNPGTEANTNAQSAYSMARAAQENALAASSYLSGAQTAQGNYQQQLAGFNAGNAAQNQAFGQKVSIFGMNLEGINQANGARNTAFQNALSSFGANQNAMNSENAARAQQYAQDLQKWQAQNQASATQYGQDLSSYGANLQGLTTNAGLQQAENQAQSQAYAQALQNYGVDWQQAQTLRNMPLNELNALLSGSQISNPQFSSYALQGQTQGADLLGATNLQAQYDQGVYNRDAAAAGQTNQMLGSLAGTAAMMFL